MLQKIETYKTNFNFIFRINIKKCNKRISDRIINLTNSLMINITIELVLIFNLYNISIKLKSLLNFSTYSFEY